MSVIRKAVNSPESHLHFLLSQANNEAWQLVVKLEDRYPQLNGRALRAGIMAAAHAVKDGTDPLSCQVESGRGSKTMYTITMQEPNSLKAATCTCMDYKKADAVTGLGAPIIEDTPRCKHLIAVWMSWAIWGAKTRKAPTTGKVGAHSTKSEPSHPLTEDSTSKPRPPQASPRSAGEPRREASAEPSSRAQAEGLSRALGRTLSGAYADWARSTQSTR